MNVVRDIHGHPLPCYGCGHSAGNDSYPGGPSGERPCLFCTRNVDLASATVRVLEIRGNLKEGQTYTARYDNGPTRKEPADQYISTDRLTRDVPEEHHVIT